MTAGRGFLDWEITTLHYPGTDASVVTNARQVADGLVTIPLSDMRTAQLTLRMDDAATADVRAVESDPRRWAYRFCLRAFYRGSCVFWGPIITPELDFAAGTIKLSASGPEIRLQHHYAREGDLVSTAFPSGIPSASPWQATVTVDSDGMRLLMHAADNTSGQTADGTPDLGIRDGAASTAHAANTLTITRGDEVWASMQNISGSDVPGAGGPDFTVTPVTGVSGVYAQLDCFDTMGTDLTSTVELHIGFGNGHLTGLVATPGGKIITHQHYQSADGVTVVTAADVDSRRLRGVYVDWQRAPHDAPSAVLQTLADEAVGQYGAPPSFLTATLRPDDGSVPAYITDWNLGDILRIVGSRGHIQNYLIDARVVTVRLRQADQTGNVQPEIDLVPNVVDTISTEGA